MDVDTILDREYNMVGGAEVIKLHQGLIEPRRVSGERACNYLYSLARQTLYLGKEGLVTLRTASCASGM